jgi:hypothetical protein
VGPDLSRTTVDLQPDQPGHYTGSFLARGQGSYFVTVEARGSGHAQAGQATLDIPYSAEYLASGSNVSFMRALADAGGGSILRSPSDAWLNNLASVDARRPLTAWLALLALLLLLLDVAVRRLIVTRSDLAVILAALPGRTSTATVGEPSLTPLGTLRRARAQRSERAANTTAPVSEPAFVRAAGDVRVSTPATARPSDTRVPPRETGTAAAGRHVSTSPSSAGAPAEAEEETTAARLLRARKRGS